MVLAHPVILDKSLILFCKRSPWRNLFSKSVVCGTDKPKQKETYGYNWTRFNRQVASHVTQPTATKQWEWNWKELKSQPRKVIHWSSTLLDPATKWRNVTPIMLTFQFRTS